MRLSNGVNPVIPSDLFLKFVTEFMKQCTKVTTLEVKFCHFCSDLSNAGGRSAS
jgi:hypothetical protein